MEFIALTIVSCIVVVLIVKYSLRKRAPNPINELKNIIILVVLEVFCMYLGKYGATLGIPWWIYYPIPMLLTIFFPPLYFKMVKNETITYILLTFISAPIIHILFSLFGWKNYMLFINFPSIFEIIN